MGVKYAAKNVVVRFPGLRVSPRHSGARKFLNFRPVIDPPRGALRGGGVYSIRRYGVSTPIFVFCSRYALLI
jgi:hypothetical protein